VGLEYFHRLQDPVLYIYIYTYVPIQNNIILKSCSEYFLCRYTLICPTSKKGNIYVYKTRNICAVDPSLFQSFAGRYAAVFKMSDLALVVE
jgi:hypothetical protein